MKRIIANNPDLRKLMDGNKRYIASHLVYPDQSSERHFELKQAGTHFSEMVRERGKLTIVPACYDIDTGKVNLL